MREEFLKLCSEISHLDGIRALLDWDQQAMLPQDGSESRANQLELISVIRYLKFTDSKLIKIANQIQDSSNEDFKLETAASKYLKFVERELKLSEEFIAKRAKIQAECFQVWQNAKQKNSFLLVKNKFSELLDVYKEEADRVGYKEHQYDALLEQYEPGGKVSWIEPLLNSLSTKLIPIIEKRIESQKNKVRPFLALSKENQMKVCQAIIDCFGLKKSFSRLDASSHPFCTKIAPKDIRITTRFDENDFLSSVGSTMHELGHALYEHNLPEEWKGTFLGEAYSLGLHESQSRFIENCIGRSKEFSSFLSKLTKDITNTEFDSEDIFISNNWVEKSLIRVDADEVTYFLHVIIRLQLEIELLNGTITVDELPEAWNQKYSKILGITPPSDKLGVLQDVHWYSGAFGYFPTYVLGNIYKGVMLKSLTKDLGDISNDIESGKFLKITDWLKINVHQYGSSLNPLELVAKIDGKESEIYRPTGDEFISYIESKS